MSELHENKMGTMPVGKLLFSMSAPMVASMMFQALYNIVDSVFVSHIGVDKCQDAINALALAFPLQMLCMSFAIGIGVGMNALLSRSLGKRDFEAADRAGNTAIPMLLVAAAFFCIIGWTCVRPYFALQTQNEQVIRYGCDYTHIAIGCCVMLFAQIYFERLLQATGRTGLAMISQVTGAIINTILDPIMIFGLFGFPRLEVMGAALATICGQTIASIIGLVLNLKCNKEIHLRFSLMRFHGYSVREILRIGIPSIFMQAIGSVMNFGLNTILNGLTEAATAVFGIYYKLQSFIFMPVFGLNNAMVPILSYNYGAGRPDRYRKTLKLSVLAAVTIMSIGTLLFETLPGVFLGIFEHTDEMMKVGVIALRVIGVHFPIAGFCIVAGSVFQALDKPLFSLIVSICRQLLVLLPAAYILSLFGNVNLVWAAFPIAEIVSLIFSSFFLRKTLKDADKVLENEG